MLKLVLTGYDSVDVDRWQAAADRVAGIEIVEAAEANAIAVADGTDPDEFNRVRTAADDLRSMLIDLAAIPFIDTAARPAGSFAQSGVTLMVAAGLRFCPAVVEVQQSLAAGLLGTPGLLRIHRWFSGNRQAAAAMLLAELDVANWLFDGVPTDVYAVVIGDDIRSLQVHLGFPDGGMALVDVIATLPGGNDYYSLSLIGGDGSAYADDHHNTHLLFRGERPEALRGGDGIASRVGLLAELVSAVRDERNPSVGPGDAVKAIAVAAAVRESIAAGQPVALNDAGDGYELG